MSMPHFPAACRQRGGSVRISAEGHALFCYQIGHDLIVRFCGNVLRHQTAAAQQHGGALDKGQVAVIIAAAVAQPLALGVAGTAGYDSQVKILGLHQRTVELGSQNAVFTADQIAEALNLPSWNAARSRAVVSISRSLPT